MTKREYAEEIAVLLDGEVTETEKANGVICTGILLPPSSTSDDSTSVRPIVYIDDMYNDDMPIEDCADAIRSAIPKRPPVNVAEIDALVRDFENVKPYLRLRLYNNKTNIGIQRPAGNDFDDLVVVPCIEEMMPRMSITISQNLLERWGITEDELFAEAEKASLSSDDYRFIPITQMLEEMGMDFIVQETPDLYVVTNKIKKFGAYGIIACMDKIKEQFPSGITVLPSSVHEILFVPNDKLNDPMPNFIDEVNDSVVDPREVLGHKPYRLTF